MDANRFEEELKTGVALMVFFMALGGVLIGLIGFAMTILAAIFDWGWW